MAHELIHIIIQYCNDPRPQRAAEYDQCVRRNLANPWVKRIHNLSEPQTIVPKEFLDHPKFIHHPVARWLTYQDAFLYANEHLSGELVCLCNLDIFLDASHTDWNNALQMTGRGIVLCQARWEWKPDGQPIFDPGLVKIGMASSQDAWLFRPPISVEDCDFELGLLGCDNAIADRFKRSGLQPINAPSWFRILHIDHFRGKTFANQGDIHNVEQQTRPPNRYPQHRGFRLLPAIEAISNLEELARVLKLSQEQKYDAICDLMTKHAPMHKSEKS